MFLYAIIISIMFILLSIFSLLIFFKSRKRAKTGHSLKNLIELRDAALELNEMILSNSDTDSFYAKVLDKALELIEGANFGSILLLEDDGYVYPIAYKGYDSDKMDDFRIKLEESFVFKAHVGKFKATTILNDISSYEAIPEEEKRIASDVFEINSVISSPLYLNGKLHGMINVDSNVKNAFSESDIDILEYLRHQIELSLSKQLLYDEVLYLSKYDAMTSVYNRRYFEDLLGSEIKKSLRYKKPFVLAVFDIDGLKEVNDKCGHLAGDVLIRTFSDTLSNSIRDSDVLARLGGDEFVAVFFNTDADFIRSKLLKIRSKLEPEVIKINNCSFNCKFSIGVATFFTEAMTYDDLINLADARMYREKNNRKSL